MVEPSFAGDDQVGVGDERSKSSRSRKYSAPEAVVAPSSMAAKPMPPAAPEPEAWAQRLGVCRHPERVKADDKVLQAGVELGDLGCGGALLGAENGGGAGQSEQRAGDVAGDDELDVH